MEPSNNSCFYRKAAGIFLVILFCGYFCSASLFPHSHIIDGVTIVHSHPYKSNTGDLPVNHNHSGKGFHLIQFISGFIATASIFFIVATLLRKILHILFAIQDEFLRANLYISSANRPRGPTLLLHN